MQKIIRALFGGVPLAKPAKPATNKAATGRDNPLTIDDGSDNATRRQLVQVLLRDVLRRHGIPPHWIECQVQPVSSRSRGPGINVRLVMRQWDERLMTYAFAFQNALLADITRFEPQAADWLHGISWQLEVADTCPYPTLPEKSFWLAPAKQAASTASASPATPTLPVTPMTQAAPVSQAAEPAPDARLSSAENDALQDLERLFVIRDQEIGKQANDGRAQVDYEKTQPLRL